MSPPTVTAEGSPSNGGSTSTRSSSPDLIASSASTALPYETRTALHLKGLVPSGVEDFAAQETRALAQLAQKSTALEKYMFLSWLRSTNLNLFYRLVVHNLELVAPIIYTPTVGKACEEYSHIYPFLAPPNAVDGLYISLAEVESIGEIVDNYKASIDGDVPEVCVITDGSRILGLGDLGINGMGIPVGKLQLYVAAGGLNPTRCLPVVLDFGTDSQQHLDDPLYLGIRRRRPADAEFYAATAKVLEGIHAAFPAMFIQFEDFSTTHAFGLLERWRAAMPCFNDDIQGTGCVVLAGFIAAVRQAGIPAKAHRILFVGAGSAGVGVGRQLVDYFVRDHGVPERDARAMFWFVDSRGLVTANRGDELPAHKAYFARHDNGDTQCATLAAAVELVRPTALIGLSTVQGAFSEPILRRMSALNRGTRPIVMPLSNPESKAECSFADAMRCSDGRVLFASGTAFPPYTDPRSGATHVPAQGNNMYVFPAIGLGSVLCRAARISDSMVYAVAKALANSLTHDERARGELYPRIARIRDTSAQAAAALIHQAEREGLVRDLRCAEIAKRTRAEAAEDGAFSREMLDFVRGRMWAPPESYSDLVRDTRHMHMHVHHNPHDFHF